MTTTTFPALTEAPVMTDYKHAGPGIRLGSWLLDALLGVVTLYVGFPTTQTSLRSAAKPDRGKPPHITGNLCGSMWQFLAASSRSICADMGGWVARLAALRLIRSRPKGLSMSPLGAGWAEVYGLIGYTSD